METEWKVAVNTIDATILSKVFVYRYPNREEIEVLIFKDGEMIVERKKLNYGAVESDIKPTFMGRHNEIIGIVKAFIGYGNEQGFKNGDETFAKGKLEATERHMTDLRKLLKL